ncbi:MAG: helix-turn-helix domain-containing protein [Ruminococcus sp.]|nr:helix-turn-helix domain-containing protein [Ruminococcus sp.]
MSDKIFVIHQKDVFTVKEAAEYLTVCPKTLYHLIECGELKAAKIGSRYKLKAEDLICYINQKKEKNQHEKHQS